MADEVKLPDTEPYRVVIGMAAYQKPTASYDFEGNGSVVYPTEYGRRGEVIDLIPREAARLQQDHIRAVVPADQPLTYAEMGDEQLARETAALGLTVPSSSADPDRPLRTDFINVLEAYERGETAGVGVSSVPGGIAVGGANVTPGVAQAVGSDSEIDVAGSSVEDIAAYLEAEKPNAAETVALAGDDPELAQKVLDAEKAAQGGDPRVTVQEPLQKIIG